MINIIQLYKDNHIHYWTEGPNVSSGWVSVQCPFCPDNSNHLGYNLEQGYFNCWKCGAHNVERTISKLLGISTFWAKDVILEYTESFIHRQHLNRKKAQAESIQLPGSKLSKYHRKYLQGRGFDPDYLVGEYGITGTEPGEMWEGILYELRIIIPIMYHNQLVSFQGRDITDKQKERYKGCPVEKSVVNYKHILYNIDNALPDRVCVVEGIIDCWRMGPGFVATLGSTLTSSQIRLLCQFSDIFFLFDPDPEAQSQAVKYASQLASIGSRVEIIDGIDKDPGALSEEESRQVRKELFKE